MEILATVKRERELHFKKKRIEEKGITLVALVITIIILIMLAGVTINLALGENGLIQKSKLSVSKYKETQQNELENMEETAKELQLRKLPEEFQEVEYIESTGTQWIDTRYFVFGEIIKFNLKYMYENTNNKGTSLFGASNEPINNTKYTGIPFYVSNLNNRLALGNSYNINIMTENINTFYNYKLTIDTKEKKWSFTKNDNEKYGNFSGDIISNISIVIFGHHRTDGSVIQKSSYKNYGFVIIQDNILMRDFIPCYSTTTVTDVNGKECPKDTIGLYDTIEGKFYTNQGTGEFLKGRDV